MSLSMTNIGVPLILLFKRMPVSHSHVSIEHIAVPNSIN